ncbi:putative membrane protein [Synechococcus sp. ROS8604]|nr:putative membrane protein [Synechococcus sp. ROS8604]
MHASSLILIGFRFWLYTLLVLIATDLMFQWLLWFWGL